MDYQLVLSPNVNLSPVEVITAWNADIQAPYIAEARSIPSLPGSLALERVVLVTTVATGVLTNVLSGVLKEALLNKQASPSALKIIVKHQPDGSLLLAVEVEA